MFLSLALICGYKSRSMCDGRTSEYFSVNFGICLCMHASSLAWLCGRDLSRPNGQIGRQTMFVRYDEPHSLSYVVFLIAASYLYHYMVNNIHCKLNRSTWVVKD